VTFLKSLDIGYICIRYIHIALWASKVVMDEMDGWFHFKRAAQRTIRCKPLLGTTYYRDPPNLRVFMAVLLEQGVEMFERGLKAVLGGVRNPQPERGHVLREIARGPVVAKSAGLHRIRRQPRLNCP